MSTTWKLKVNLVLGTQPLVCVLVSTLYFFKTSFSLPSHLRLGLPSGIFLRSSTIFCAHFSFPSNKIYKFGRLRKPSFLCSFDVLIEIITLAPQQDFSQTKPGIKGKYFKRKNPMVSRLCCKTNINF